MGGQSGIALIAVLLCSIGPPALALYTSSSPVVALSESNLESKVKAAGLMLVEALQPEYEKLAKALKGMVSIGAVDCDVEKGIAGKYGVQGFPTIKLLYTDGGSIKTSDYSGGRTAKEMLSFVLDKAKSLAMKRMGEKGGGSKAGGKTGSSTGGGSAGGSGDSFYSGTDVVTLEDSNFQEEVTDFDGLVFVEFYAPWCGHCKNLKPVWIDAAAQLKDRVKVAAVDCTANQASCGEFGVKGYPTIKFFGKNKHSPEDYNGGRDSGSIVQFATQQWSKSAPAPEVKELVDEHVFEQECLGDPSEGAAAKQLCFIAFLPDLLDSKASGRNSYIKILKKLADQFKDRPFSYLWASATQQAALEDNFGVGGFGYPALVAFKPKDKKFSVAKSAFEVAHVQEFIERIRKGGESVFNLHGDLSSIQAVTPWDGKDAKIEEVEEFSLEDLFDDKEL